MRSRLLATAAVAALTLAACGGGDDATTESAPRSTTPSAPVDSPPTEAPTTDAPTDTSTAATSTDAATTAPEPEELETIAAGPYDVGVTTITIDPGSERPLTVDVWFPIDDAGDAPAHQYTLIPGVYYESPGAVTADATAMSAGGPFPLVVYSHGSGGLRYIASHYTEAIASHGYVVAAPDHTGNTAADRLLGSEVEFDVNALARPGDVAAVIDALTDPQRVESAALIAGVDPEAIAVTGHSFGGFTAMAMASGYTNGLGSVAADPRVDAVIPVAPATGDGSGRLLSDADLQAIAIPMLLIGGTADRTTPIDPNVTRPWESSPSDPLYRLELIDAQHNSFTDICAYQTFLPTLGAAVPAAVLEIIDDQAVEGCAPETMDSERVDALTTTFAVRFLESIFRGDEMIDPATTGIPDDVVFMVK